MKKLCRRNFCYLHMCILQNRKIQTRNTENLLFPIIELHISRNSCFRVTMKLLMIQLHNTNLLKASSVKVEDIMLTSAYISWNYADLSTRFLINPYNLLKKISAVMCWDTSDSLIKIAWYLGASRKHFIAKLATSMLITRFPGIKVARWKYQRT